MLLRFLEKEKSQVITLDDSEEPSAKRAKTAEQERIMDTLNDCMASDVMDIKDPVELEVYGNEKQASLQLKSYNFEVCIIFLQLRLCFSLFLIIFFMNYLLAFLVYSIHYVCWYLNIQKPSFYKVNFCIHKLNSKLS